MKNIVILSLLFALIGISTYSFFQLFEYHEEEKDTGYSLEARQNPYLAAIRFLEHYGIKADANLQAKNISTLATDKVLFIERAEDILSSSTRIKQTLQWAEAGGSLILGTGSDDSSAIGSIFQQLGVEVRYAKSTTSPSLVSNFDQLYDESLAEGKTIEAEQPPPSLSEQLRELNRRIREGEAQEESTNDRNIDTSVNTIPDHIAPVNISFTNTNETLTVHFDKYLTLTLTSEQAQHSESIYTVDDDNNTYLIHIPYGEGFITLLSDTYLWRSSQIHQGDNAYFLKKMVASSELYIIYQPHYPSLLQLLSTFALEFITICGLLIILWLWSKGIRVGRIIPVEPPTRRDFTDHVRATADFYTSQQRQDLLLAGIKQTIVDEIKKRDRHFEHYSPKDQAETIARYCSQQSIDSQQIQAWLAQFEQTHISEVDFIQHIQLSDMIRKQL